MKKFFLILLIIPGITNGQLFNKLERRPKTVAAIPDSVYLRILKIKTTVEDSVFNYEDIATAKRYEIPECGCLDTKGKKIGDVVVTTGEKFQAMINEVGRFKKRKWSRKSDLEN